MIRQDEIHEAAKKMFDASFESSLMQELLEDLKQAFVLGATWADQHPYIEESIVDNNVESLDLE